MIFVGLMWDGGTVGRCVAWLFQQTIVPLFVELIWRVLNPRNILGFNLLRSLSKQSSHFTMENTVIGIIGMGGMGKMYARRISSAGWK